MATNSRRSLGSDLSIRARWLWRKIERQLPTWLSRSLPWGSSLLVHAVALFFMAVVIRFVNEADLKKPAGFDTVGQLQEDVTSSKDSDQSGDSFTSIASDEPPSMPKDLTKIDETVTAVAELPDTVQLGPELNLEPSIEPGEIQRELAESGAGLTSVAGVGQGKGTTMTAPMLGRSGAERANLVRREGGSVESEKAVERGLDFLARHQREDGGWSLDTTVACSPPGCPKRPAMESDVAATGLALLPMLGAGNTHTQKGRYQLTVRRGLGWLLEAQQEDGMMFTGGQGNAMMYSHCIATLVLCESYALTRDRSLRLPAEKAVGFIIRAQHAGGGWRYRPMEEGDTCVFGWAIFALRSANIAGIAIPRSTLKGAARYLDAASTAGVETPKSLYGYQPGGGPTATMTAEALVCRQLLGWERDVPALIKGVDYTFNILQSSQERNIYYWYYATQLLHNMKDKNWPIWNQKMRDSLISLQVKGNGCDRGSWDPEAPTKDAWGGQAGRLFTTSLSLLTLEVYYRYLPMYKDQGGAIDDSGEKPKDKPTVEKNVEEKMEAKKD